MKKQNGGDIQKLSGRQDSEHSAHDNDENANKVETKNQGANQTDAQKEQ